MRITICAYDAPGNIDGPSAWLKRLLPYLKNRGFEIRILFLAANSKRLPTFSYLENLDFECKLIPGELFWEEKIQRILKDLNEYPPNIFIPNYFPSASYAASWAKKAGIPTVIILHNDNDMHHALVDVFGNEESELRSSAIVAVSESITNSIRLRDIKPIYFECIPCGAPIPEKTITYNPEGNLKLVYAGRFNDHQKRVTDVAKAFCRVVKEIPGTECVMYGNGEALKSVLELLKKEGVGTAVKYGGVLSPGDVQDKFMENHVFVLLSDYEGIPIALMESMACGLVPVCSKIKSGIDELVDEKTGIIVNDRKDEFVKAIRYLKNNPEKLKILSVNSRQKIINDFSQDMCNKKWENILLKVAENYDYIGNIEIPTIAQLKKINLPKEFQGIDTRMPKSIFVPLYKLYKVVAVIKNRIMENFR